MKKREKLAVSQILKNGFLFVDIPRTSSTSIRVELGKAFGLPYGKSKTVDGNLSSPQIFKDHMPAKYMKQIIGGQHWDSLFVFTLVRNPWDRIHSLFKFRVKKGKLDPGMSFRNYILSLDVFLKDKKNSYLNDMPMDKFLNRGHLPDEDAKLFSYTPHFISCSKYIFDSEGNNLVSFIGKYENRINDLGKISERIGLNTLGEMHTQETYKTETSYVEAFDQHTKEIIADLYQDDIKNFGYKFEG